MVHWHRWLASSAIVFGGAATATSAHAEEVPIVYSRCLRATQEFKVTGPLKKNGVTTTKTITLKHADLSDALPDTANDISGFIAPCDLVYRDAKGDERILYSCIDKSTPDDACAALDASVSFDAKTVAFAVFRGELSRKSATGNGKIFDPDAENTEYFWGELPSYNLKTSEAHIVLADIATGKVTPLPAPPSTINFGPTWTSDGRITFSSVRRPIYRTMPLFCSNNSGRAIQLYAMDPDGRNVELTSPHALGSELHPIQLVDGRLAVSSWQMFGMLAYRHGNSWQGCGTLPNFFHVYGLAPDGSDQSALYGQHLSDPKAGDGDAFSKMASHFFGQSSDGRVWTAEYYRGNNLGLGNIVGFSLPPPGQEGPNAMESQAVKASVYRAPGQVRLAKWASAADQAAMRMPEPPMTIPSYPKPLPYAGKLGHPSGLPGNALMVSWGVGPCSQVTGKLGFNYMHEWEAQHGDSPVCDVGIYRTRELPTTGSDPVAHPSELIPIVNSPDYHEFMARPVVPYSAIYNAEKPAVLPRAAVKSDVSLEHGAPFGVLGASSILHRETKSASPISFEGKQWALQGTDAIDYTDDELCGIRILAVYPNRKVESSWKSATTVGERVAIVGEFPVRKPGDTKDGLGMPDTSFRVRFPADIPYLMQGIDCEGRALNTDQTWQSLRPGEVKTCNGCHVHSAAATALPFETTLAASDPEHLTAFLGMGKVPLLAGGEGADVATRDVDGFAHMIEFDADIMPIFQRRCVSCHSGESAKAGLRLDVARDWTKPVAQLDGSTYARLVLDTTQKYVPAAHRFKGREDNVLAKPNVSKYIRMMNSRGSLLYWKAANARTDNRTDNEHDGDVDFGPAHPTEITPEELGTLARWIETGAGGGPEFTQDNLFPTLTLVGVSAGQSLTAVRVGTVDTGSGVDPDSLVVCVASRDGDCGPNLATKAEVAGVVTIPLEPALTDLDTEIVATVKDRAGNERDARYTVRHLLSIPPPANPGKAAGDEALSSSLADGDDDDAASGCACHAGGSSPPWASFGAWLYGLAGVLAVRRARR